MLSWFARAESAPAVLLSACVDLLLHATTIIEMVKNK
jgi:hypothetical protein